MFTFSHHRLIHQILDRRDPRIAVIAYKTVVTLVYLCIFLNSSNVITFVISRLSSLDITCRSLHKVQLSEQRICGSREITDRRQLVKEIHNYRLLDVAQKEVFTDAVHSLGNDRTRKFLHRIKKIDVTRGKHIPVGYYPVAE